MEQLPLSFSELLQLVGYFSALTLLLGTVFQLIIIWLNERRISVNMFLSILITQILVFIATTYLWLKWPMGLKIIYGPILFPALLSEILIIPVIFGFYNYRIFKKKK
ncbi:MAG: hypothetical protein REI78_11940 [Pedobacter sp.]|nr:hypothetical protein [Pedobacter sp.]MDQ8053735.1 hypothetical protein [Pedobacter sp.]